jgi:RNA polymerase-binding transcription factor DksA
MRQITTSGTQRPPVLTPQQLAELRERLEEQRRFRIAQLDDLRAMEADEADEVTEVLAEGARVALRDVLDALHRIDDGTYGRCVLCGDEISLARLEVIPAVAECLPCRSRIA